MAPRMIVLCGGECGGCACHRAAPCAHCTEHVMEPMMVHKEGDCWQFDCPICVIPRHIWLTWGAAMDNAHAHIENHIAAVRRC